MARFLVGLCLAAVAFGIVKSVTENMELAVFAACMVAIGIWFKAIETLFDALWSVFD
ncbi:hypothetical protein OG497_37685 [Streptomyces sp. NBC_01242]|uniref:hypothetical protein n=1 Tax=Streptomyces sp. NBC_01242 TaxID=2903795 RepID=UPI002256B823|nr:hypothetical protein [Streptomyces sp. NBC_01242]MCX4799590.1 hypothetical protein [Streptomyces sp. NBC_01242]